MPRILNLKLDATRPRSRTHDLLRYTASVLALVLICAPSTIGAIWAFPIWDDASVWLLLKEHGVGEIAAAHRDRPVMASLWALLATSERGFWGAAFIAQAVLWPIFGGIAALLWSYLFPSLRRYAFVVGCVTVAPFLTKVQMLTANIALASLLSVVLGYGAILVVLRFVTANDRFGRARLALSMSMLASAILLTEYALSVAIVMLVLLLSHVRMASDPAIRVRAFHAILLSILIAGAAYATYVLWGDRGVRPNVGPLHMFTLGEYHLVRAPFRFVSAIWRGLGGGFATSLGEIALTSRSSVVGAGYGALVAGLLVYGIRDHQPATPSRNPAGKGHVFMMVVALVGGLIPVLAMGRMPWDPGDGMSSRFGLPVLPIAAAIMVRIGIGLVRERFWVAPVIIFGLAAGNAAFMEAWSAIGERRLMAQLGAALQARVATSDDYTVAVVPLPERTMGPRRQWELTARIAATWPPELRRKFWAYRFGGGPPLHLSFSQHYKEEATEIFGTRTDCKPPRYIDTEVRLVARRGRLNRLLWVAPLPDGSICVEPYCIGDPSESPGVKNPSQTR